MKRSLPSSAAGLWLSTLALALGSLLMSCATSDPVGLAGPGNGTQDEDPICLLNNCSDDSHCGGCGEGLNKCLLSENRCVGCDRETGTGCKDGERCSAFGKCVPEGLTCPVDAHGTPTVTCVADGDCAACDPLHQLCNPATGRCVACTPENRTHCQSTDTCVENQCLANCPASCDRDSDCATCGTTGHEAHGCNAHRCSQCSATLPCPQGQTCTPQGTCKMACGKQNDSKCDSDADCVGCGTHAPKCNKPINGGVGTCGPLANGCSDLGKNAAVLPAPFDQVTNLCSKDADCSGIGVTVNVGKMLKDLTNINGIGDANITYGMNRCAAMSVGNTSCGACVPCKVDVDCKPIDIDKVAMDAFGPLGSLAAAFLLDQVFGPSEHQIHMYCDKIAGDYGACLPCPSFFKSCSTGGYSGGGSCGHGECQVGAALNTSCSTCSGKVCNVDSFCCSDTWDSQCVQEAAELCGQDCSSQGSQCSHDECGTGGALGAGCSSCATSVCNADPFCCTVEWDALCVQRAGELCSGKSCGGSGSCGHDECQSGASLKDGCSSCAGVVCNVDSYCCNTQWDDQCVQEADQMCSGKSCGMGSGCGHDECTTGVKLTTDCSSCAAAVCQSDAFCCSDSWDATCVSDVGLYCPNKTCGGGGGGSCNHDPCYSGSALLSGCSGCVTTVCASDSYCCSVQWDSQCVSEAQDVCNMTCDGGGGGQTCEHDECQSGGPLTNGCSSCVSAVCANDAYCCNTQWDAQCVTDAASTCSLICGSGPTTCAHDECVDGAKLTSGCSSCVTSVCNADPYCCSTEWDPQCVGEVDTYCTFSC